MDTPEPNADTSFQIPDDSTPEVTLRAVGLGLVLAIVLGAANAYLGLYAGMTVSASIPAAVISMAILRGVFRTGTILENNIVQTLASTGESLAAGVIFTVPALVLIGAWTDFEFWPTTLITMLGGLLGVIFMIPLRRALIVERPDLPYPEGVACSEVLKAGEAGSGGGIRIIAAGVGVGGLLKFLVGGIGIVRGSIEGAFAAGRSVFYAGTDVTAALIGVGYIVNIRVASQVFLGGAIAWFVALPSLGGYESGSAVESALGTWSGSIRYLGVGAMLVGGVASIWQVRRGLLGGLSGLRRFGPGRAAAAVPRTERDMPFVALLALFVIVVLGIFGLYEYLIDTQLAAITATIVMIAASFLFVAVATYIVGLVGSSNSPVSGMTICALLLAAGVLLALGVRGETGMVAVLGVAGVVCCATCTAGDIAQDLKTGQIVGSTPARQQWVQVLSVIVPSFVFAPVLSLLHKSYGIGDQLRAPQATLFANLTQGLFGHASLPLPMVYTGAAIGVGILAADFFLKRSSVRFRLHIMPVAVGIYLPLTVTTPIFIGGLLRAFLSRGRNDDANNPGVLFGSGLIAGEALMGIALAGLLGLGWFPLMDTPNTLVSIAALLLLLGIYVRFARPSSRNQ
jgi:putative OPT family oligopeptide transporter